MTELERYRQPTDSWVDVIEPVGDLASKIADTDFVPKDFRRKPAAVAAAILYGREIGLAPMTSLRSVNVIHGTPSLESEAMRALILSHGHHLRFVETTATRCIIEGCRRGSEDWARVQYTMDEAKQAGDVGKNQNYRTRPTEMLIARATSRMARMIFADVIGGLATPEDIDLGDTPAPAPTVSVEQEPARKSPAKRKPKAAPTPPPQPETAQDGPPLPGEDGYEQLAPEPATDEPEIVDGEIVDDDQAPAEAEPAEPKISGPQMKKLHATLRDLDVADREHGLSMISDICGQPIESTKDLTREQASMVIDTLSQMAANEVPT